MKIQHWYRLKVLDNKLQQTVIQYSCPDGVSGFGIIIQSTLKVQLFCTATITAVSQTSQLSSKNKKSKLFLCFYLKLQISHRVLEPLLYELMFMTYTWRNIEGSSQAPLWILQPWRFCWFLQLLILKIVNQFPGFIVFYLDVQGCKKSVLLSVTVM